MNWLQFNNRQICSVEHQAYQSKICSDQEILDTRLHFLVHLSWRKTRRENERWYRITKLRMLWRHSIQCKLGSDQKENEAYLKRKNEEAASLAEKEIRRLDWGIVLVQFCLFVFLYPFRYTQLTYNTKRFDVKGRKQEVEHCRFWIAALTLLCIRDFHSLLLPEESSTFAEIVLGSGSSDFDGNGI